MDHKREDRRRTAAPERFKEDEVSDERDQSKALPPKSQGSLRENSQGGPSTMRTQPIEKHHPYRNGGYKKRSQFPTDHSFRPDNSSIPSQQEEGPDDNCGFPVMKSWFGNSSDSHPPHKERDPPEKNRTPAMRRGGMVSIANRNGKVSGTPDEINGR